MLYLFLLIAFWPLLCCEKCDYSAVCVTISIAVALVSHIAASIVHELRLLATHRYVGRHKTWRLQ